MFLKYTQNQKKKKLNSIKMNLTLCFLLFYYFFIMLIKRRRGKNIVYDKYYVEYILLA